MLVELAAANAAFAVIKEAVQNSGDLMAAGNKLFEYFDNKSAIQKKAQARGSNSDLQEFMALEQLKKQEAELKEIMIYQGRGGLWSDWLQFQADAKKRRDEEERQARLKKQRIIDRIKTTLIVFLLVMMLGGIGVLVAMIIIYGNK